MAAPRDLENGLSGRSGSRFTTVDRERVALIAVANSSGGAGNKVPLVVDLWSVHGWDHLAILIYPETRDKTVMHMRHNFNGRIVGRNGVPMEASFQHNRDRIVIVYKAEPTQYVPM